MQDCILTDRLNSPLVFLNTKNMQFSQTLNLILSNLNGIEWGFSTLRNHLSLSRQTVVCNASELDNSQQLHFVIGLTHEIHVNTSYEI